jgi:putative ATP-dependent endonuclease of OLD family
MALRELLVEGYRGVRFARLGLESSTVLVGENDCGKSSLLEALSIVLSPLDESLPSVARWQLHGAREAGVPSASIPLRIRVTLGESRAGSWDRPEASALVPVLGGKGIGPRVLTVEVTAGPGPQPALGPVETHVVIRSPGGRPSRDDPSVLAAVRRLNPFVWLRGSALVRSPLRVPDGEVARDPFPDPVPEAADVLRSYKRLLAGEFAAPHEEIELGFEAAERLLARWLPDARAGRPQPRATVGEILGRGLEDGEWSGGRGPSREPSGASTARKLGVLLMTARLVTHLRGAASGVRPTVVIEDPESGLHPMTLASAWALLERLPVQKLVTTHSGALLSAMPLRSLRRLERDGDGVVREFRVRQGALGRDELRKVSYHLCSRRPAALFARTWLLVEGETEFWLLPDLARLCGRDLVQEGIACVEFAQCGLAPLIRLANALGIGWHVLVDGDRAGETYARLARSFVGPAEERRRLTVLAERDIEHCFWRHGYARVFESLAGMSVKPGGPTPRRVIQKAIDRESKPAVAFELFAAAAAKGSPGPPRPLRSVIDHCVSLARKTVVRKEEAP